MSINGIGYGYGFVLGKFASADCIKPKSRAHRFHQQVRVGLLEKQLTRFRYGMTSEFANVYCPFMNDQADEECDKSDMRDKNDCHDDPWLAGIICQRQFNTKMDESQIAEAVNRENQSKADEEQRKEDKYNDAMERTKIHEAEQDKEHELHRNRIDQANAQLKADRYVYLKKKAVEDKQKAAMREAVLVIRRVDKKTNQLDSVSKLLAFYTKAANGWAKIDTDKAATRLRRCHFAIQYIKDKYEMRSGVLAKKRVLVV